MKRFLALLITLLCLCSFAHAEQTSPADWKTWLDEDVVQQLSGLFANDTLITAVGTAQVEKTTDIAVLTFSMQASGESVAEANAQVMAAVETLRVAIMEHGVQEEDISRLSYDVSPNVAYHNTKLTAMEVVEGYIVEMVLTVRVYNLSNVGMILDAATQSGAGSSHDLLYESSTAAEAYRTALAQAAKLAMEKAQLMAEGCGLTLGDLVSVVETSAGQDDCAMVEVTYRAR